MPRVGTLLGTGGRPETLVQIIRKTTTTTRIRYSTNHGRSWSPAVDTVNTDRILDDGGKLWELHSANPGHATWLNLSGEPAGRLSIQRVYQHVTKAKVYIGNNTWSRIEDFPSKDILFDGGVAAGWRTPGDLHDTKDLESTGTPATPSVDTEAPDHPVATNNEVTQVDMDQREGSDSPHGQRISYIRVSTEEQNLTHQREAIGPVDKEFQDTISARSRADRAGLEACIDYLNEHDQLVVVSIDRLARSLVDLQGVIAQITAKGASVHFLKEGLTFSDQESAPRENLMLEMVGSFAEFERSIIKERQAEGIALAKKAGKYKGRKRALTQDQVLEAQRRVEAGEKKAVIARDLGISRATLYRTLADS